MFKPSKWSLSVRLSCQNLAGIFPPPMCNVCLAYLIFLWFCCSNNIWVRSTDHQSPQFAVPSSPMWPYPSKTQISFSAPCSQTPSACVPPSVHQVSHPYKIQDKLMFWMFESSYFWIANWEKENSISDVSMYSQSWVSSQFLHECSFDLLGFSDIWTLLLFQRINYRSLCCDFVLRSVHETGKSVNSLCILHCIPIFSEGSDECRIYDQYWPITSKWHWW